MDLATWTIMVVVGGVALTVLLTGPGLWSDKWGWGWIQRRTARPKRTDHQPPD